MNSLYEFGSQVDIIIRVKSARNIGGISYDNNEIYTILKDVAINFTYEPTNINITAKQPVYKGDTQKLPIAVDIFGISCTDKIFNLIGTKLSNAYVSTTEIEECIPDENGMILLKWPATNIFVYRTENGNKIKIPFTNEKDILYIQEKDYNHSYTVIYQAIKPQTKVYSLEQEYQPYFSAELITKGNTNKNTRNLTIVLPTVKIDPNAELRFTNEGLLATSLRLNIIYQNQPKPVVVFN